MEKIPKTNHWPKNRIGRARVRKFNEDPVCYYCDRSYKRIRNFSVDHVNPVSKGGGNGDNLVLSCRSCNHDKGDLTPDEYMELCLKRAKRVMYVHKPSLWKRLVLLGKVLKVWIGIKSGKR